VLPIDELRNNPPGVEHVRLSDVVLPDLMPSGLRLVICGTAAGTASALAGAYYAGAGNKFWTILLRTGLIDEPLGPSDFRRLPEWGIGLTDVSKIRHGMDHQLGAGAFDPARLWHAVGEAAPNVLAFNGKAAARAALGIPGRAELPFGPLAATPTGQVAWVLPSTSGAAGGSWDPAVWHALAAVIR
jgi:TDG/mug DNA glycosylase family protein